jgi:hypothetical protein
MKERGHGSRDLSKTATESDGAINTAGGYSFLGPALSSPTAGKKGPILPEELHRFLSNPASQRT